MIAELAIILKFILVIVICYIVYEQWKLWQVRQKLPGPKFLIPFFGSVFQMVLAPYEFYEKQKTFGPVSFNLICGQLFVFTRDPTLTKKVFANEGGKLRLWLHYNAEAILGSNNIAFMSGDPHKALRMELIYLFTKKALGKYLTVQETQIRNHIKKWKQLDMFKTPREVRTLVRDLNIDTSIQVFIGNYIGGKSREEFKNDYLLMNEGLLAFPLNIYGTKLYNAIQARKRIITTLIPIVQASQKRMSHPTAIPESLIDEWMSNVIKIPQQNRESDEMEKITALILDLLFAAQDASTSSLVWIFELLSRHQDIWKQIIQEQDLLRPSDDAINLELLEKMDITNRFVKEVLRFVPPAVSVPHLVLEDFQLTETYTAPKGTVLFPSIQWAHSTDGWDAFDVDRWTPERREESNKHFLTFGIYAHKCLGQEYAQNHLKLFTSIIVKNLKWKRISTSTCQKNDFLPTIVPADGCVIQFLQ